MRVKEVGQGGGGRREGGTGVARLTRAARRSDVCSSALGLGGPVRRDAEGTRQGTEEGGELVRFRSRQRSSLVFLSPSWTAA